MLGLWGLSSLAQGLALGAVLVRACFAFKQLYAGVRVQVVSACSSMAVAQGCIWYLFGRLRQEAPLTCLNQGIAKSEFVRELTGMKMPSSTSLNAVKLDMWE